MTEAHQSAELAEIAERLRSIRTRMAAAAQGAGRAGAGIQLIGASKRQSAGRVAAGVRAGIQQLGENYVQEAQTKHAAVSQLLAGGSCPAPRWRMIGGLQRNKAAAAADLFDAIDSVDRISLASAIDRRCAARNRPLDLCLQVNLSAEVQKSGCSEAELEPLLAGCAMLEHVRVVGLMTIPETGADPRPTFARLRVLRDALRRAPGGEQLTDLSMGMSADFEIAIEEGATHVRVGSALFGPRSD